VRPTSSTATLEQVRRRYRPGDLEYVTGTLTSRADAERAVDGVEMIYHAAAAMRGDAATIFTNTVVASKYLVEALPRTTPPRIVLVSSMSVYAYASLPPWSMITEETPLEMHPEKRDAYTHAKLRQEQLFRTYQEKRGFELVVLRPGVIYGPGRMALPGRVGLTLGGFSLLLGRNNPLPLSFVDNAAEAVIVAARFSLGQGEIYNVVDDDAVTARQYAHAYKQAVSAHCMTSPWPLTVLLSWSCEKLHRWSRGLTPAVLTTYKTACLWRPYRYSNEKLKRLGWKQLVSSDDGMRRLFTD
jgi:nucleoside-diphosphate-sugar epimerase